MRSSLVSVLALTLAFLSDDTARALGGVEARTTDIDDGDETA